jgi:hypothetical protein
LSPLIQINPKFFKIQQSPAKPEQSQSKKKAWISLDSLGGNEPFQGVVLTPQGKKPFLAPFSLAIGIAEPRFRSRACAQDNTSF